jgi:hypothetical protein
LIGLYVNEHGFRNARKKLSMLKQCRRIVGWFGVANDRLHPEVGPPNLLLSSLRQPGDQWVKPADMSILCGHAKTWPHFPSTPTAPSISTSQRKPIHRANARMSLWRNIESERTVDII